MVGLFSCNTEKLKNLSKYLSEAPSRQNNEVSGGPATDYESKTRKRQYLHLPKSQVQKILQGYEDGKSTKELAIEFDRARVTISNVLKRNNVKARTLTSPSEADVVKMAQLYETGLSLERVGEKVGFSTKTVHNYLRQEGTVMRSTSGL